LDDVSLTLYQGEALGIVGESGCGKSTLARCITGITSREAGSIKICNSEDGHNVSVQPLQMIFQDPYASLNPGMRVGDIVGEALDYYRVCRSRIDRDAKVAAALERVGLPRDAISRFPHQFSGGQRQRISIARALICDPRILVCDEPTSALDVSVQRQILELLEELQREERLSILFISHDLAVVRRVCTQVAVMRMGKIVEIGDVDDVFDRPVHSYTRELLAAMPSTALLAPLREADDVAAA
jgi:ABC-type oligopeptide transport system ATPase subunit